MSRLVTCSFIAAVAVLALSCGTGKGSCSPSNCSGCCDATGTCKLGNEAAACGNSGGTCTSCSSLQFCGGGTCLYFSGGSGVGGGSGTGGGAGGGSGTGGGAANCAASCAGCCSANGTCMGGNALAACGKGGAVCEQCIGAQTCNGTAGACYDGSCGGCIDISGTCRPGTTGDVCGKFGGKCKACTGGSTCSTVAGICTGGVCDGCFDVANVCQPGNTKGACGSNGDSCSACSGNEVCINAVCTPGSGTGGGDGAGVGGGSGGGGVGGGGGSTLLGDSCSSPQTLTLVSSVATTSGSFSGFASDDENSCGSLGVADRVYSISLVKDAWVRVSATGGIVSAEFRSSCSNPSSVEACATNLSVSAPPVYLSALSTHWLWVQGSGAFTLTVRELPFGDICENAEPLSFSGSTATVSGMTSGFGNDYSTATCTSTGPDHAYSFSNVSPQKLTVTATGISAMKPSLLLSSGGCSFPFETACHSATAASNTLTVNSLPAGNYVLWVDDQGGTSSTGYFSMTVALTAPTVDAGTPDAGSSASGDSCSNYKTITLSGTTTLTGSGFGDTSAAGLANNNSPSCAGSQGAHDMVFRVDAPKTGVMSVTATPLSATYDLNLSVRFGSTCGSALETTCQDPNPEGGAEVASFVVPVAGTYWIWISGYGSSYVGPFTVSVSFQ